MKLGGYLWLALCVTLLGWYGWAMVAVGTVLYVIVALLIEKYTEYRAKKKDEQERYQL
jgi:hypothetical protein